MGGGTAVVAADLMPRLTWCSSCASSVEACIEGGARADPCNMRRSSSSTEYTCGAAVPEGAALGPGAAAEAAAAARLALSKAAKAAAAIPVLACEGPPSS